jgi:hypothetical protein
MFKFIIAATAALTLVAPLGARAQDIPSYAQQSADEQIRGYVESFDGGYNLAVRDERGFIDNVQLHDGTIINPTGITLEPGMVVSIVGENDGDFLSANEIDTPYDVSSYDGGIAYYDGRPWDYYVGPSFGLTFFFGNVGWWHGNDFHGGFHYNGGARVYNRVAIVNHVENTYGSRGDGTIRPNPGHDLRYGNEGRTNVPVYRGETSTTNPRVPVYRGEPATYRAPAQSYRPEPAYGSQAPVYRAQAPSYRTETPAYRAQPAFRSESAPSRRGGEQRSQSNGGDHGDRGGDRRH